MEGINRKLIKNKVKCKQCEDIIESKHRHDFVSCKCGKIYIDGGLDYQRLGYEGKYEDAIENLCIEQSLNDAFNDKLRST
jgi:hypothetical protein